MKKHSILVITLILTLLILIVGTSVISTNILKNTSSKFENIISGIQNDIYQGKWSDAENKLAVFEKDWPKMQKTWAILIDHLEIDNIDTSAKKLSQFVSAKDLVMSLSESATLKQYITHIPIKESFLIENIF